MTTPDDVQVIRDHKLWAATDRLRTDIRTARGRTATDRHTLAHVEAALTYLLGYKSLDPHLFPSHPYSLNVFQSLEGSVAQLDSQLEGWDRAAAMSGTTVNQLDQHADRILETLSSSPWPSLQKESRAQVIVGAAEAFQRATAASVEALLSDLETAQEEVEILRSKLTELEGEAFARGEQAESSLREIEEARVSNVAYTRASVNTAIKAEMEQGQLVREEFSEASQVHLDSLIADAKRGQKLVKLVGDQAVGEGYARFAGREMWAYRLWNTVGVLAGVAVVVYLGYEFRELNEVTLQAAIVRVALSVPGLGIAAYAFQQASRRHKQSVEARYRALDLLALGPFTNEMGTDQQTTLRVALGQRLFASNQAESESKPKSPSEPDLSLSQVQALVDLLKSARELGT